MRLWRSRFESARAGEPSQAAVQRSLALLLPYHDAAATRRAAYQPAPEENLGIAWGYPAAALAHELVLERVERVDVVAVEVRHARERAQRVVVARQVAVDALEVDIDVMQHPLPLGAGHEHRQADAHIVDLLIDEQRLLVAKVHRDRLDVLLKLHQPEESGMLR